MLNTGVLMALKWSQSNGPLYGGAMKDAHVVQFFTAVFEDVPLLAIQLLFPVIVWTNRQDGVAGATASPATTIASIAARILVLMYNNEWPQQLLINLWNLKGGGETFQVNLWETSCACVRYLISGWKSERGELEDVCYAEMG